MTFAFVVYFYKGETFSHSITLSDTKHTFTEHSIKRREINCCFQRFSFIRRRSFVLRRINRFTFTLIFQQWIYDLGREKENKTPLGWNRHDFRHHIHHSCRCWVYVTLKNVWNFFTCFVNSEITMSTCFPLNLVSDNVNKTLLCKVIEAWNWTTVEFQKFRCLFTSQSFIGRRIFFSQMSVVKSTQQTNFHSHTFYEGCERLFVPFSVAHFLLPIV